MTPVQLGGLVWAYCFFVVLVGHLISPSIAIGLALSGLFGFIVYVIKSDVDYDQERLRRLYDDE